MLDTQTFKTVIENVPLVAIDLCLVCGSQILLGKRNNEPLKGQWFTPGGRIHKNEMWRNALHRVVSVELGLDYLEVEDSSFVGIWDHFYTESAVGEDISTHYVSLTHNICLKSQPVIIADDQHKDLQWFELAMVSRDKKISPLYTQLYELLVK